MICHPCRKQDHENCDDNPRKLAFARGELIGIIDGTASRYCDCLHREPIMVPQPVKAVVE
jgi:hypothetical protein